MKVCALLAAILAMAFSSCADFTNSPANFSPHFPTNTKIFWKAPTDDLPKSHWLYKRLPARPFPANVISNAIVLASLQSKGFPKPSTNDFFYAEDQVPDYPGPIPVYFSVSPKSATISYGLPHPGTNTSGIPADRILLERAWTCAVQLGVNPRQVTLKEMTCRFTQDENYDDLTNQVCGRGVFLSRKLDGILFWSSGTEDDGIDGFWIEFGSHGQIRAFSLVWPDLIRDELQPAASPQQIINCIRAQKTIVLPNAGEETYFQRIKALANAKTFTVTKITPYYMEGMFGQTPTNDEPSKVITPIAELEAVADFGNSTATVRLISPIIASEVKRLLQTK